MSKLGGATGVQNKYYLNFKLGYDAMAAYIEYYFRQI